MQGEDGRLPTSQEKRPITDPPLSAHRGIQPSQHLDFRLQASKTESINFCSLSHPACGILSQ